MLPEDPVILLSYVNTKLRDFYPSLEEMCKSMQIDSRGIIRKLQLIGYEYDRSLNQFV